MPMTDEEKFRFDLTGYLLRPSVLTLGEVDACIDQIDRMHDDPESLPPEHRASPGGALSVTIDHPKVVEVLHEIIGPQIRMSSSIALRRSCGQGSPLGLHQGGAITADPIFGYRVQNGRFYAGMIRVVFELAEVGPDDGATSFLVGSHKSNFPLHPDHMSLDPKTRSEFLHSYTCPPGSVVFFTEQLAHAGTQRQAATPRYSVFNFYSHVAINHHLFGIPKVVIDALPRSQQAYFRTPWLLDFRGGGDNVPVNTVDRFVNSGEPPMDFSQR